MRVFSFDNLAILAFKSNNRAEMRHSTQVKYIFHYQSLSLNSIFSKLFIGKVNTLAN